MMKNAFLSTLVISGFFSLFSVLVVHADGDDISAITNCSGTQVVRTASGSFEVRSVEANLPGCTGERAMNFTSEADPVETKSDLEIPETPVINEVTNCSGLRVTTLSNGQYSSTRVAPNLPGCIDTESVGVVITAPRKIDTSHGPLLDLASTDIAHYKTEKMKEQKIRFIEVTRSARMRRAANMEAQTNAYLMKNDAVVISGKETGWVKVQGAEVVVTDLQENTIATSTGGKASGYTASKFLRMPNNSDLVRIEQADHAYWSDIARVKVAHLVNVRVHPWYGSSIVTTLENDAPLYVVSTVDNWSEVRNDSGTIRGYIRSDFLTIDQYQRVDQDSHRI